MSAKETAHYDYSKPFAQQVQDCLDGKLPTKDAIVVSGTPEVLQKIGLSNLPITINQEHIKSMSRDMNHRLSNELIKQLPELLKDPLAVIESQTGPDSSVVVILRAIVNGKPYLAPIYVSSTSNQNNMIIDSNNIATVFRKDNAVRKLLTDAIQKENAGKPSVYYWKKSEARSLYSVPGVQFPGEFVQDGLIHSIFDAGADVKKNYLEQTETRQFKRWFEKSKVVNGDGSPKVVYYGTNKAIEFFDEKADATAARPQDQGQSDRAKGGVPWPLGSGTQERNTQSADGPLGPAG